MTSCAGDKTEQGIRTPSGAPKDRYRPSNTVFSPSTLGVLRSMAALNLPKVCPKPFPHSRADRDQAGDFRWQPAPRWWIGTIKDKSV